jgi:hypothetical protein
MNRNAIIILAGSIAALVLGITVAYPMLISEFPYLSKADLNVDVMYAYIAPLGSDSNQTGLWWNGSIVEMNLGSSGSAVKADGLIVSYLVVLNVTNNSNETVRMKGFEVMVGPQISVDDNGLRSAVNPIITDSRHFSYITIETDDIWLPQSWKLIGLFGVAGVHEIPYSSLDGAVFLYGYIEGQIAYSESYLNTDYSLKQVQFQSVEDAYLYNDLLNENQILLFYQGLEVLVATRR